jgi:RNA polymerase sigma-70 factor, ECF subfamily
MQDAARRNRSPHPPDERPSGRGVVRALEAPGADGLDGAAIVALVRRGDRRGAALLYDRFAPLVRRLVGRTFGPHEDARDLTQEVLIAVVEAIGELRDPSALPGFVYGVAINVVRMELRRRSRRRFVLFGSRPRRELAAPPAAHEPRRAIERLYELLAELGEETRMLFVLRHVEELPLAEIAQLLGWSLATTKRRLARATKVLWAKARAVPELACYVVEPNQPPASVERDELDEEPCHG